MRGKRCAPGLRRFSGRNIPAYAGKTPVMVPRKSFFAEHPRVCGENTLIATVDGNDDGTSPRMRGKLISAHGCHGITRNIPAYAGKTLQAVAKSVSRWEHPRVCGENIATGFCKSNQYGTSPRMRGKLLHGQVRGQVLRNIPAYAGKTPWRTVRYTPHQEHPRVCGENPNLGFTLGDPHGTSPRMRGKPYWCGAFHAGFRNIPAYAGKTLWWGVVVGFA